MKKVWHQPYKAPGIFSKFSTFFHRPTDRQTDRPTKEGRHRSSDPGALKKLLLADMSRTQNIFQPHAADPENSLY